MDNNHVENLLRVKGINAQGFGTVPKLVMRDRRLSSEAKAIYSYIRSFAGNGTTAFPSVIVMAADLNQSIARFYRHRKALIDLNYIEISRERVKNRFGRNIYELIENPVPLVKQDLEGEHKESEYDAPELGAGELDGEIEEVPIEEAPIEETPPIKSLADVSVEETALAFAVAGSEVYKAVTSDIREYFSFACQLPNYRDNAYEIIEAMNDALIMSQASTGYKYKKKSYNYTTLSEIFRLITTEELESIQKSIHPEFGYQNIRNRSTYIMGCIFKAHEQRSNNPDSS